MIMIVSGERQVFMIVSVERQVFMIVSGGRLIYMYIMNMYIAVYMYIMNSAVFYQPVATIQLLYLRSHVGLHHE